MKKNSVIIIAEAGVNHNGNINLAKELIEEASKAGADYVKFQTWITDLNISKHAKKAEYQINDTDGTQYEMIKKLELSYSDFSILHKHCKKNNIGFLSTAADIPSIDFLDSLNLPYFKIPSGEINNKLTLEYIGKKRKPVILSTGMANMSEIKIAVDILMTQGLRIEQINILHCNTEYPTPMKDVNLNAMLTIQKELGVNIGYSDHTLGIEVPIAAVALGANIIEKHFTLNKDLPGPDHKASLNSIELKAMVEAIRNIEKAISGNGKKTASQSELKNINIVRKSIVASKPIMKDEIFTINNLTVMRPGNGISPMRWDEIIGKKAIQKFDEGDLIEL